METAWFVRCTNKAMSDNSRIYDLLMEQGKTLARIDQSQDDMKDRLFGTDGLKNQLDKTTTLVFEHEKKLSFWRGGFAVMAFLWSAGVAYAGVILHRHK